MFVKVRVPATSANLGPGFDVAGLAVTLYNTFTFELLDEGLEILGCPEQFANKDNLTYRAFEEGARYVGLDYKGLRITNEGDVPYTRGLGSSSTCIVAGIVGLSHSRIVMKNVRTSLNLRLRLKDIQITLHQPSLVD